MTHDKLQQPIPITVHWSACLASSNTPSPWLYVTGGTDNNSESMYNLQMFDWSSNSWSHGPSMKYSREEHGCVVVNDWLWVMGGGYDGEIEAINTTNINDSDWSLMTSFPPRDNSIFYLQNFGVVAVDNLIYVIGGCWCSEDTMYIIDTNHYTVQNISMGFSVNAMPAVVVDNIIYGFGGTEVIGYDAQTLSNWAQYNLLRIIPLVFISFRF